MATSTNSNELNKDARSGYAPVNGLNLYYEIYGTGGPPLVLLHGGLGTIGTMFGPLMPGLAATRQVIGVELQAHGHTGDIDRPLSFELMADDIAGLLRHLGLASADIFGYSLGGGVALQTAIRYPAVVRKLVIASAPCKRDGWYPEVLAGMAAMNAEAATAMVGSPIHAAYASVAPDPAGWPVLIEKVSALLKKDYDWSAAVAALKVPVLLMIGDADSVRPAHAVEFFSLLGGGATDGAMGGRPPSQLAVLPDTSHFTIVRRTDLLPPIILAFLNDKHPDAVF